MWQYEAAVSVPEHLDGFTARTAADECAAARSCVAQHVTFERGRWTPPDDEARCCGWLGLLVLDGLLTRVVDIKGNRAQELLGPGDVLRPWEEEESGASVPSVTAWRVVERTRIAVLDEQFAVRATAWPGVGACLIRAALRQSRANSTMLALTRARHADERLMLLFWHLADRWGRVQPEGVHIPLRLTHALIADLVCLRRPTVTTALTRLGATGTLLRLPDRTWQLPAPRPATTSHPAPAEDPPPADAG